MSLCTKNPLGFTCSIDSLYISVSRQGLNTSGPRITTVFGAYRRRRRFSRRGCRQAAAPTTSHVISPLSRRRRLIMAVVVIFSTLKRWKTKGRGWILRRRRRRRRAVQRGWLVSDRPRREQIKWTHQRSREFILESLWPQLQVQFIFTCVASQ